MHTRLNTLMLLLFFWATHLSAQETKVYETSRTALTPRINGVFDDPVWQNANWQGDFTQHDPDNGAAPSQPTTFAILYDDDYLYVAIKAQDDEPEKIERRLSRRDSWEGDIVGIHLDSYFDRKTAFLFMVSAAGVKNDGFVANDNFDSFDGTWDPIWEVKTKITADGWNAEMKIPLSQLRFGEKEEQVWGMQIARNIFRKDEWSTWQFIDKKSSGWVSNYAELRGMNNIHPKKQVEIAPFVVTSAETYEKEAGNPFADGRDFSINTGIDGKIGLTNDLILDFAINPDFGQVEADPSEVNLTAFETFFQEKRPFFIEGNNITNFKLTFGDSPWSRDNLFYSRRIGRRPTGYPDLNEGEYAKIPINTRILGAFKLTGKTKDGWSIGIIESVTNREKAIIDNAGKRRKETVEPLTNYFIARLQKDLNDGNTIIGGMMTSTYRDIQNKDLLFLPKSAITGGMDFTQYFKDKTYFIAGNIATSRVSGDKTAIQRLQESSRHYFQRPDADYLNYDVNKTILTGTGGSVMGGKISSSGWRFLGNFSWRSPGLELNDVGFLRQANSTFEFIWIGYQVNKPFSIFRSLSVNSNQWAGWDFGGTNLFKGGNINVDMQFTNFWSFGFGVNREGRGVSNTTLRGGPAIVENGNWNLWANLRSSDRKKIRITVGGSLNVGDENASSSKNIWGSITYRPINSLSLSVEPGFSDFSSTLQYVDQADYHGDTEYLFGSIHQKTFNLTMTVNYSLTPDLSIQYYGAPFISGGLYSGFKKITQPQAVLLNNRYYLFAENQIHFDENNEVYNISEMMNGTTDYSFGKPDFNFRQFRSNLVLRWEYKPGSTLFLVWSKGQTNVVSDGHFNLRNDWSALSKTIGDNVFLLKASYRFQAGDRLFGL